MEERLHATLRSLIDEAAASGVVPGAAVAVAVEGRVVFSSGFGGITYAPWSPRVDTATLYDLASITKPLATALLMMAAVEDGLISVQAPVGSVLGTAAGEELADVPLHALLAHSSGLPSWLPLYEDLLDMPPGMRREAALRAVAGIGLEERERVYSDLGFIVLGLVAERLFGMSLGGALERRFPGLGLFFPAHRPRPGTYAPTEYCPVRGRVVAGEVHDLNAWVLGGEAGHAGMFGSLSGVVAALLALRAGYLGEKGEVGLGKETVSLFLSPPSSLSPWPLGFDTPAPGRSAAGRHFPKGAVGHLGFTGTSFWWALEEDIIVVCLSNRTFPSAPDNPVHGRGEAAAKAVRNRVLDFRSRLHDIVMEWLWHG